ncbi:Uncharacterised protein [Mycobacterium tuberculosis]|nr:Uncharacterised protein [Mycobacterium tuberculosis]
MYSWSLTRNLISRSRRRPPPSWERRCSLRGWLTCSSLVAPPPIDSSWTAPGPAPQECVRRISMNPQRVATRSYLAASKQYGSQMLSACDLQFLSPLRRVRACRNVMDGSALQEAVNRLARLKYKSATQLADACSQANSAQTTHPRARAAVHLLTRTVAESSSVGIGYPMALAELAVHLRAGPEAAVRGGASTCGRCHSRLSRQDATATAQNAAEEVAAPTACCQVSGAG